LEFYYAAIFDYLECSPKRNRVGIRTATATELVLAGRVTLRLEKGAAAEELD
jgi:hypothetical protein